MRTALTVTGADGSPKTYSAGDKDMTMGLCEDVIHAFRADLMADGAESPEAQAEIARALMANLGGFYPLASRIFPGMTEDEWRSSNPEEAVAVMRAVLLYAMDLLGRMLGGNPAPKRRKNRPGTASPSTRRSSTSPCPSATVSLPSIPSPSARCPWRSSSAWHPGSWTTSAGSGGRRSAGTGAPPGTTGSKRFQGTAPHHGRAGSILSPGAVLIPARPPRAFYAVPRRLRAHMAQNDYIIGIGMGLDPSGLKAGLEEAKREMALADSEFQKDAGWIKDWDKSIEGLQAKLTQMTTEIQAKKDIVELWRGELERVIEVYGEGSKEATDTEIKLNKAETSYNKAVQYTEDLRAKLAELEKQDRDTAKETDDLSDEFDGLGDSADGAQSGGLKKLKDSLGEIKDKVADKVKSGLENIKEKFKDLASKGIGKAVDALKDFIRGAVSIGKDYTSTMSMVKANSQASAEAMEKLDAVAKEMGASTTFSATEAAEALNYMALAGWDAEQSAEGLGGILDLAAAAQMDLGKASDMVTDYLGAFGLAAKDSGHFADILAYAQSNANTTAEGLGEAFENVAATMGTSGQSIETTTALLMAMANQGTKGSRAGTALNAVMRDLTKKMKDGSVMIGDTAVAVSDEEGNFRDLITILYDAKKAVQGMGTAEAQSALMTTFTSDSIKAVNEVFTEGVVAVGQYRNALKSSDGTAKKISDTMTDNLSGDLKMLDSAVQDVQLGLFELIEGPLRTIVQLATEAIKGIKWLAETIYNALVGLYNIFIKPFIDEFGGTWDTITGFFGGAGEFFGGVGEDIKSALGGALNDLGDWFGSRSKDAAKAVKSAWDGIGEWFGGVWDSIKNAFSATKEAMEQVSASMRSGLQSGWEGVKGWFGDRWSDIKGAFSATKEAMEQVSGLMRSGLKSGWEGISGFFGDIWTGIKDAFSGALSALSSVSASMRSGLKAGWEGISGFFGDIWTSIKSPFAGVGTWFRDAFSGAFDAVTSPFSGIGTWFQTNVLNPVKSVFQPLLKFFGLGDSSSDTLKKDLDNAKYWRDFYDQKIRIGYDDSYIYSQYVYWEKEAARLASEVDKAGSAGVGGIFAAIKKPFEDAWNWIRDTFGNIGSWLSKNIIDGLVNGLSNVGSTLTNAIGGFCGDVIDGIKNFFGIHSPSTLMRDEVGLMIGAGMAEGIRDSYDTVRRASDELSGAVSVGGTAGIAGGGAAGGKSVTYVQNITSPTALSTADIYRQTRTLVGRSAVL